MTRILRAIAAVLAAGWAVAGLVPAAHAQVAAVVVAACGTPPGTYSAGNVRAVTQDTTGKLCDSGGGGGGGSVTITGPLGAQAPANGVSVTLDTTDTLALQGILAPIPLQTAHNVLIGAVEGNGTAASPDTHALTANGPETQGAAVTGGMNRMGCRAASTAPTVVTDGQAVDPMCTPEGKTITAAWAPEALRVRGYATTTGSSATEIIAAPGAGSIYVASCQFGNTSATAVIFALNDGASSGFFVPAGGASNIVFAEPLKVAATTHLTFAPGSGVTTSIAACQGYTGP